MFDVGGFELLVIILAIIVLFGPESIPKFMQQVGRGVRQFRKAQEELTQQIRDISAEAAIRDAEASSGSSTRITVQPAGGIVQSPSTAPGVPEASASDTDNLPDQPTTPTGP